MNTIGKSWDELSNIEQYKSIFSDMYKDAYGIRPRGIDTNWTEEEYLKEFEYLDTIISRKEQIEKEIQEESITSFELLVTKTINMGAYTRENAIRWIIDDERDIGYVEYSHNLPYGYLKDYI
jgi:hypothetical protein